MNSISSAAPHVLFALRPAVNGRHHSQLPCTLAQPVLPLRRPSFIPLCSSRRPFVVSVSASGTTNSTPKSAIIYTVGDFMTKKEDLHVVKPTTTVDEALESLVDKRITGFPVVDDTWKLAHLMQYYDHCDLVKKSMTNEAQVRVQDKVGVVSDYDLLALDSISGGGHSDANLFPDVDSSWKAFNRIQRLLTKTNGKVVGDLMTPAPLVVRETTNLEDAVRLLLETKYRRLPVVDSDGRLVGIITRGNVVRAALQIKRANERYHN